MFKFFASLVSRISVPRPPRWSVIVIMAGAIAVGVVCWSSSAGCGGCGAGGCTPAAAERAIVDCVHQDQARIQELLVELGDAAITSVFEHGEVDWQDLALRAAREGVAVGGCAFAEFVHGVHSSSSSSSSSSSPSSPAAAAAAAFAPLGVDPKGIDALERFRHEHGGVRWVTRKGAL